MLLSIDCYSVKLRHIVLAEQLSGMPTHIQFDNGMFHKYRLLVLSVIEQSYWYIIYVEFVLIISGVLKDVFNYYDYVV
jgi:hypothetical protein